MLFEISAPTESLTVVFHCSKRYSLYSTSTPIHQPLVDSAGRTIFRRSDIGISRRAGLVFEALRRAQEQTGNNWLLDSESPGKTRVTWCKGRKPSLKTTGQPNDKNSS